MLSAKDANEFTKQFLEQLKVRELDGLLEHVSSLIEGASYKGHYYITIDMPYSEAVRDVIFRELEDAGYFVSEEEPAEGSHEYYKFFIGWEERAIANSGKSL